MSRGKHATSAEARRAREDAISEVQRLRREVSELRTENDTLARSLLENMDSHAKALRDLQVQLIANTSPELEAERERNAVLATENEGRTKAAIVVRDAFGRIWDALQDAYEGQGMLEADAHESKMRIAKYVPARYNSEIPGFLKVEDLVATRGTKFGNLGQVSNRYAQEQIDPDELTRIHRLQRAKGLRK